MIPHRSHGLSLIEALIAIAVFTTAFVGFFSMLQSIMATVAKNKARLGALALVEEQIEYARSLPFSSVGTVLGNPLGILPQTETTTLNGITYTRRNAVSWIDDSKDGIAPVDTVSTDYKQIKVEVSWNFRGANLKFFSISNITPKGLETPAPGGIFKITVFDAAGTRVQSAKINIFKSGVMNIDRYSNTIGEWFEYGIPPGTDYAITVTKSGYSTSSTYGVNPPLTNPSPAHLTSIDDVVNAISFAIDKLSSESIYIFDAPFEETWTDPFANESKLSALASTTVTGSSLRLTGTGGNYDPFGTASSTWIAPANIHKWKEFSWNDTEQPGTQILYRIYYDSSGGVPALVPDSELPGNSLGFGTTPVSLASLNTQTLGTTPYTRLMIGAFLSTTDLPLTPFVQDWTVIYERHVPKANFTFHIAGTKTIGTDSGGAVIRKYEKDLTTDATGRAFEDPFEWDTYGITVSGYDMSEVCPPQPHIVAPDTVVNTYIDLAANTSHSLLLRVVDTLGAEVPDALVRLTRTPPPFDSTKAVQKRCAEAFWSGLSEGTVGNGDPYTVSVSKPPHTSSTTVSSIDVSGESRATVTVN